MTLPAIWFWQRMVSPHMAGLADAVACAGSPTVYVAEQLVSPERAADGWTPAPLRSAELKLAPTPAAARELAASAPPGAIHICQGIRANGVVREVQRELARGHRRQWIIMETVDDEGWRGPLKRHLYRQRFASLHAHLEGVLAIGERTPDWLARQGMDPARVWPFAYFLPAGSPSARPDAPESPTFRIGFVGRLIPLKRLALLIESLAALRADSIELVVVGDGPMRGEWQELGNRLLPGKVRWLGRLSPEAVTAAMRQMDCVVLPSRHDGWGAVVSEALIAGTPVICSDACGAATAVRASGRGGVFPSGDATTLASLLERAVRAGRMQSEERVLLARWARSLGAEEGARYLLSILAAPQTDARPAAPWLASRPQGTPAQPESDRARQDRVHGTV